MLTKQIVRQSNIIKTLNQSAIVATMADCFFMGYTYIYTCTEEELWLSSYLVWVGVKFSNAKEEELLINDASQIGSKKFDFSIE